MNLVAVIIGILCLLFIPIALLPILGLLNYIIVPVAVLGAIIGAFGEKKTGLVLCLIAAGAGVLRLMLLPF